MLLEDADFERAVKRSVLHVFQNSGQSCNAPTRMLVPAAKLAEVEAIAQRITAGVVVGDPASEQTTIGPLVSKTQFDRVERYIEKGIAEGAKLVTRRRPAGRVVEGLLRQAHDLLERAQRHDDCARGDFRTRALHPAL